ncbi:MAG: metal ABC transporter permease [Azoarcus sp.]|jgi:zinc transport system permease protein|nr:metal ABC transporter permease [Azoarcus sp.]
MTDFLSQLLLFWRPGLTGALLALLLPLLGLYLRLRQEYWAALAYGQVGAAGALGAMALGLPHIAGGLALGLAVAGAKHRLEKRLPPAGLFPLLFILGWSLSLLLTANLPGVERLGAALFEGQLYFAGVEMLCGAALALIVGTLFLWRTGRLLLLASLCPVHCHAQRLPVWRVGMGFDLLAAASLALAVMSLGVMGAFALVFIPPWLAFALAPGWRAALAVAPVLAFFAYVVAFVLALIHDQPFGPTLVLVLGVLALPGALAMRFAGHAESGKAHHFHPDDGKA